MSQSMLLACVGNTGDGRTDETIDEELDGMATEEPEADEDAGLGLPRQAELG